MKVPCQTIVWDVLPAIRAAIAEELVNLGISQQEIARLLDMVPSAISQYLSKKRGYRIEFEDDVRNAIRSIALDLSKGEVPDLPKRVCTICTMLQDVDSSCKSNSSEK
ncbi:putative transcriptional regulator [Methanomethylovorans hollandica DSM 15978]|uniref:Putative transcriptional regulator n=1 Tax=Methanomethylovorans hollandica (strain DSM 15978 / NBRC 107637 / DMS1) TaxID=867904 RepID=L0KXS1_METHD|nr:transcriptional regulator [Methanomethylovorans hollandica]AGB48858.1 putative transcriptional regulator [Methanomethylovorans hollandica DSM 15978]